ncbi:hypothetical protein GGS20DRAFT_592201 [Poronia punctata]|nr:hypothetical protein GGS20DRAFT_592201 [Poronia punctata]
MWSTTLLLTTLLPFTIPVSANKNGLPTLGPKKPGIGRTPEALLVSEVAGRHPNATTSVNFKRTYNNTEETWSWRINVTELALPDDISDLGTKEAVYSRGWRIANTQWELGWPGKKGDETLEEYLAERNLNASFTTMMATKPASVTANYDDADEGDCEGVLGDECLASIVEAARKGETEKLGKLDGCKDTLGAKGHGLDDGVGFDITGERRSENESKTSSLHRGDSLLYRASETYETAEDPAPLNQAKGALQLFIMHLTASNDERGDISGPTVLCRIVDKDAPGESLAVDWGRPATTAVWGIVLLGALFTAL